MAKQKESIANEQEEKLSSSQIKEQKKQEKLKAKEDKKNKKAKKEKKPGLFKKLKDAWGELKKVTWPTFGTVVKKTSVVILITILFTIVLFGIDSLLGFLYSLFMPKV